MVSKIFILSAVAALFASNAAAAVLIATDPGAACGCPNNCDYGPGHSCKYYAGPSDDSTVVSGHCVGDPGSLTCQAD